MPPRREVGPVIRRLRASGRRLAERLAPTVMDSLGTLPRVRTQAQEAHHRATTASERIRALENRVEKIEKARPTAAAEQISALQRRVASLEAEVQEARRLNRHVAEVTDVVQEVLLPTANRDDDRLREVLDKYRESL